MRFWKSALALLCFPALLLAQTAPRFTPESGLWWNPAEDGRGYAMEIQDNIIAILVYGFDDDAQNTSAFYTAAGAMQDNAKNFTGTLDGATNGQCLTCAYAGRPIILTGDGGPISVVFTTESRGQLTMGGRTFPIERFSFALGNPTERMLGEWQVVLDFSNQASTAPPNVSPFYGDVFTFDTLNTTTNPDQYQGCRPTTSLRRCTTADKSSHSAAGFHGAVDDVDVIVVKDFIDAGTTYYLAYYVTTGLSQFDGVVAARTALTGPDACSPVRMAACFPVRGFRSASKRFVQTGTGPSSVDPKSTAAATPRRGVVESMGGIEAFPEGLTSAEVKAQYGIDMQALEPRVQALIQSMQ